MLVGMRTIPDALRLSSTSRRRRPPRTLWHGLEAGWAASKRRGGRAAAGSPPPGRRRGEDRSPAPGEEIAPRPDEVSAYASGMTGFPPGIQLLCASREKRGHFLTRTIAAGQGGETLVRQLRTLTDSCLTRLVVPEWAPRELLGDRSRPRQHPHSIHAWWPRGLLHYLSFGCGAERRTRPADPRRPQGTDPESQQDDTATHTPAKTPHRAPVGRRAHRGTRPRPESN